MICWISADLMRFLLKVDSLKFSDNSTFKPPFICMAVCHLQVVKKVVNHECKRTSYY